MHTTSRLWTCPECSFFVWLVDTKGNTGKAAIEFIHRDGGSLSIHALYCPSKIVERTDTTKTGIVFNDERGY